MTVGEYLGGDAPDIKELLCLTLGTSTAWLFAHTEYTLSDEEITMLNTCITKRKDNVPLAYLQGSKGFYHLDFIVTRDTLVPRNETEQIIDIIKELNLPSAQILDMGTGSGVIAITLKSLFPEYEITACDISQDTLNITKKNAHMHNVQINCIQSNWFENISSYYDIIISNPPYIDPASEYMLALKHEPALALVSGNPGEYGMKDITHIINHAPKYLASGGYLLLEHGFDQREYILPLLAEFTKVQVFDDVNGVPRNILAQL